MSLFDDAVRYWDGVDLMSCTVDLPAFSGYCDRLSRLYANGGASFRTYRLTSRWTQGSEFDELSLITYLIKSRVPTHPRIIQDFGGYRIEESVNLGVAFKEIHPYELPGLLAILLQVGGAYSPRVQDMERFDAALSAAREIASGDLNGVNVWISHQAWSSYFHDVAWDVSLVLFRPIDRLLMVLMATDTD
jgi:hypothetical protein